MQMMINTIFNMPIPYSKISSVCKVKVFGNKESFYMLSAVIPSISTTIIKTINFSDFVVMLCHKTTHNTSSDLEVLF